MRARTLLFPLMAALALRFSGLGWDLWHHQHPDERFLVMVANELAFPRTLKEALDPSRTPLNPQNRGFSFFVYGALFPSLNFTVAKLFGSKDYTGLLKSGRVLSATFDGFALVLLALTAGRLGGARAGHTVAWLYAFSGLLIQNARFGTPDALGLFAVSITLFFLLQPVSWKTAVLAGLGVGLAAATRPNLATLALPVALAVVLFPRDKGIRHPWPRKVAFLFSAGFAALLVWKLLDPGFFASAFSPVPHPRRLASFYELASMMRGEGQFPPNLQWVDRGFLFLLWNYFFWGLGPALGLAMVWAVIKGSTRALLPDLPVLVLFSWFFPYALLQATHFVAAVRHFLPATPFLFLLLAFLIRHWRPAWHGTLVALTVPWGLAWTVLAWQPYTRAEASRFLEHDFPPGTVIATEAWDDALPIGWGKQRYRYREIPVYEPDTQEKREELLRILKEAHVITLSSQRGVGSVCRVPDAYPLMSEFYHLLFSGQLGFRLVHSQERRLLWGLSQLGAEEALSVYDHPPVWIFAKSENYDHSLAATLLGRVQLPQENNWHTRDLQARGLPPYLMPRPGLKPFPSSWGKGLWAQGVSVLLWLLVVEWLGLLATVALRARCGLDAHISALLGRPVGMLGVGMLVLWGGTLSFPGWQAPLALSLALAASWKWRVDLRKALFLPEVRWARVLFLLPFFGFLLVRAFNPEIYWGEKPMDSAIFTILLRSPNLPPQDPWFAGYPLNYYFFGFLPYVFLTKTAMVPPTVAFNLATATVPALSFVAAAACGFLISQRKTGAYLAGTLTQLAGTAYLLVHPSHLWAPSFDRFWASSRVIAEGINEYPVWTALFADLHAHFLSIPGFLAGLALLLALVVATSRRHRLVLPLALVLATQYMSNTWEMPALAILFLASVILTFGGQAHGPARAMRFAGPVVTCAGLLVLPFTINQYMPRGLLFWEKGQSVSLGQYLELYGVHGIVFLAAFLLAWTRLSHQRLRGFLVIVGLIAGLFAFGPRIFTLMDKMNTYFKLGLQAFLLLGACAGGLWAASLEAPPTWPRRLARGFLTAVLAVGLVQAAWNTWAVVPTRRVSGPRPTLDGQAYLPQAQPEVAAAVRFCQEKGLFLLAEEARPPYADTLRLPMLCGAAALAGWEYHLWQRGKAQAEIRLRLYDLAVLLRGQPTDLAQALAQKYGVQAVAGWEKPPAPLPGFVPVPETGGHLVVRENWSQAEGR